MIWLAAGQLRGDLMFKRIVCMLIDHNWTRHRYQAVEGDDQPQGTYLKCVRCGKINDSAGLPGGPMVGGF